MSLETIKAEYEDPRVVIGPVLWSLIERAIETGIKNRDPQIYAGSASWDSAREDLFQEFVTECLLEQGQLAYAMNVAKDEDHFRRLLIRQVRRVLSRRRRRGVVDNILDRCRELAKEAPFEIVDQTTGWSYRLVGRAELSGAPATSGEIAELVAELTLLPKIRGETSERAPRIFARRELEILLVRVGRRLPNPVSIKTLASILESLLTPWSLCVLVDSEEYQSEPASPELSAEDRQIVESTVDAVVGSLRDMPARKIFMMTLQNLTNSDLSRRLRISRPTVIKQKAALMKVLGHHLESLEAPLQVGVLEECQRRLLSEELDTESSEND